MNWWGKLIGGAAGFAIAGPIGALVGTALGHAIDRRGPPPSSSTGPSAEDDPTAVTQTLFFGATFAVMGHLSKIDGQVSAAEIRMAERIMDRLALDPARRQFAQYLFRLGKRADFPLDDVLDQLRHESRSRDLRRVFLEIQVFAAYADGQVHARERDVLERISIALGFDVPTLAQIERLVQAELGVDRADEASTSSSLAQDYALLGVDQGADLATVKRAYRRMMSQHHPDRLISRGLPEEMIRLATSKTQAIKAAYERIRAARS